MRFISSINLEEFILIEKLLFGGQIKREMFYVEDFDSIQKENENFTWHCALSEPQPKITGKVYWFYPSSSLIII